MSPRSSLLLAGLLAGAARVSAAPDRVVADFEQPDFAGWTVEGDAFGPGPVSGEGRRPWGPVSGYTGKGWAGSAAPDATAPKSRLVSAPFVLDRPYLNFLIAGGERPGALEVRLVVDGKPVRTATGTKSRRLLPFGWDVRQWQGRQARLEIVDEWHAPTRWDAFLAIDDVRLSDRPVVQDVRRQVVLDGDYLNLPVAAEGTRSLLRVEVDGQLVRETNLRLAPEAPPPAWASLPVGEWRGKTAVLTLTDAPVRDGRPLAEARLADRPLGLDAPYREALRPQYHFTALQGWLNDPNGLLYADGRWHLYFQYDPVNTLGLSKSWGHAVSPDLFHWEQKPTALFPRTQAVGEAYSGSAVLDRGNRAGFGQGGRPPVVAVFTDTAGRKGRPGPAECLAYSNDGGTTFTYYGGNPVLEHRGRDPKVFWYPPEQAATQAEGHWVMAVFKSAAGKPYIDIYTSPNLKDWTLTDTEPGYYECPELVRLPLLDGRGRPAGGDRWVMWGADGRYRTGTFDGAAFTPDSDLLQTHYGAGYASQTWNEAPDGRVVQIFWLKIYTPDMPFNQMMSVPLELSLRATAQGPRLHAQTVRELDALRGRRFAAEPGTVVEPGKPLELAGARGQLFDILVEAPADSRLTLELGRDRVVLAGGQVDGTPLRPGAGAVRLRVLLDRPSLEVIANDGEIYTARRRIDAGVEVPLRLAAEGAPVRVKTFEAHALESAWPPDFKIPRSLP